MGKHKNLLTYELIEKAINGDSIAIQSILQYYDGYISTTALISINDKDNNKRIVVDYDLKNAIIDAILLAVIRFKIKDID